MSLSVLLFFAAAVLCMHCTSPVEGVIPACADTPGVSGRLRCVNWQVNATGHCTNTYTFSSFVPALNGITCIYSPGFVDGGYANNAACTWIVPKTDNCSSLEFMIILKDLAHNEENGQNCANNDHLDVDNGQQLYCDANERNNCPFNNCPSVSYITDAPSLEITLRTDGSNFSRGVFAVVFEVPNGNCAGRRKRTTERKYDVVKLPKVLLPNYCPQHHHHYRWTYHHYKPTPCECIGNCTATGTENLRAIVQKIIKDNTGKEAAKYINSESNLLQGVARLVWQNLNTFNVPIPTYEDINDASCTMPPKQSFEAPNFRPIQHPWASSNHRSYSWTTPTQRLQQWAPYTKQRPHYRTTTPPRVISYRQPKTRYP